MKEQTHLDKKIVLLLHKLGVGTFNKDNNNAVYELVDYIRDGILSLDQTSSSRHDWSINVEDIKKFSPTRILQSFNK